MTVLWAIFNDLAQRIVTMNKQAQRATIRQLFREIGTGPGARVLDFGCGTGLFATTISEDRVRYVGYDPDSLLVDYANWLYPSLTFTDNEPELKEHGPYDAILANCVFHHIPEGQLADCVALIKGQLRPGGHFILVDILAVPGKADSLSNFWGLTEQGEHLRAHADYLQLLARDFDLVRSEQTRAYFFSTPRSPFYSDLGIYICRLPAASAN